MDTPLAMLRHFTTGALQDPTLASCTATRGHDLPALGRHSFYLRDKLPAAVAMTKQVPASYGANHSLIPNDLLSRRLQKAVLQKLLFELNDVPLEPDEQKVFISMMMNGFLRIHVELEQLPWHLFVPRLIQYSAMEIHDRFNILHNLDPATFKRERTQQEAARVP